jgi:hypothetical protein
MNYLVSDNRECIVPDFTLDYIVSNDHQKERKRKYDEIRKETRVNHKLNDLEFEEQLIVVKSRNNKILNGPLTEAPKKVKELENELQEKIKQKVEPGRLVNTRKKYPNRCDEKPKHTCRKHR